MCGKRLKKVWLPVVLFFCLYSLVLVSTCSADVVLTDLEAQQLMTEIQAAKTELTVVKENLTTAQEQLQTSKAQLQTSKAQLQTVNQELTQLQITCKEQKTSYLEQLKEADKKTKALAYTAAGTGGASVVLIVLLCVLML